jgi:hypothetical protein
MKDFADTRRALESRDTLTGTFEIDGQEFPIELVEPTLDELEEIDEQIGDSGDESEAIRLMIDKYLERPAVNPDEIGVSKLFAVFEGMRSTWQGDGQFDDARGEMPVNTGNSQNSRR